MIDPAQELFLKAQREAEQKMREDAELKQTTQQQTDTQQVDQEREQQLRQTTANSGQTRSEMQKAVNAGLISQDEIKKFDESLKDIELKVATIDQIRDVEKSFKDAGVPIPPDVQKSLDASKAAVFGKIAPFVDMNKEKIDVQAAIKAGVSDEELRAVGISQVTIARIKKDIRAGEQARKVDIEVRKIYAQDKAERDKAYKSLENYVDSDTGNLNVTKAATAGVSYDTVRKAGYQISKEDYESSKWTITSIQEPEKPKSYEQAESDLSKAADKIWSRKGLTDKEKADLVTETPEWKQLQEAQAQYAQTLEARFMDENLAVFAAEMLVPGVMVARHWNELEPWERAAYIAVDVASLIPFYGAVVKGARSASSFGRLAMAKSALNALSKEAIAQVMAPVSMILHPVETAKAGGKQLLNFVENVGDLKKAPYTILTTTEGTVRIKVTKNMTRAEAIAAGDILMDKAMKGERIIAQVGDQTVEVATSPFMREVRKSGGAAAHATPFGEEFVKAITATAEKGGNIYFANEPLTRFAEQTSRGVKGSKPTIYIVSTETAKKFKSSDKLWQGTRELEKVLPVGESTAGPLQKLTTRIGPNATKVDILLESPLSKRQLAKLKAEFLVEAIKAPFKPAITSTGDDVIDMIAGLSKNQVDDLARIIRDAGNPSQARALTESYRIAGNFRQPPRPLTSVTGRVSGRTIDTATRELERSAYIDRAGRITASDRSRKPPDTDRARRTDDGDRQRKPDDEYRRRDDEWETPPPRPPRDRDEEEPPPPPPPRTRDDDDDDDPPPPPPPPPRDRDEDDEEDPPPPPPPRKRDEEKKETYRPRSPEEARKRVREAEVAIAWRQGRLHNKSRYDVIVDPFTPKEEYLIIMGQRPRNAKLVRGPRSAYNSAQTISGHLGKAGQVDIPGLMHARLWPEAKGKIGIQFARDANISNRKKVFPLKRSENRK